MAEITVSVQAYTKLLLHAAKYPHCAVNGVLLADNKDKQHLNFVDCIPLFHLSVNLAPMLEASLLQIDSYCRSKGYVIAGYYQANEHYKDNGMLQQNAIATYMGSEFAVQPLQKSLCPNNAAKHIGRKIHEFYPDACIFMINNERMSPDSVSEIYTVYTMKDSVWKEAERRDTVDGETLADFRPGSPVLSYRHIVFIDTVDEETLEKAKALLQQEAFRQLTDFDNHLDDFSNDWRNLNINNIINHCC